MPIQILDARLQHAKFVAVVRQLLLLLRYLQLLQLQLQLLWLTVTCLNYCCCCRRGHILHLLVLSTHCSFYDWLAVDVLVQRVGGAHVGAVVAGGAAFIRRVV